MGQSTDGILTFGVDLGEYKDFMSIKGDDGDYSHDWDDFLYKISGIEKYDYSKLIEFEEALGVELVQYCSCDYPMYILSVAGTTTNVSRGYVEEIDPIEMAISPAQVAVLKDFWDKYIVVEHPEYDENYYEDPPEWSEPKWLLASNWC